MHYNLDALRRSLGHFLVGKSVSALSSLLLLVLLARWLSTEDYAVYVSLQALVVIVTYLTSLGINQSLLRYIPELRVANNNLPMYGMVSHAMVGRALTIGLGFLLVWAALEPLGSWFKLSHWQDWIPIYLLVGWVRIFNQFLGRIMESLLWQKQSQYNLALGILVRLGLVVGVTLYAQLDIPSLFLIELAGELLTLTLLLCAYLRMWRGDPHRLEGDPHWWRTNRQRTNRYALWAYLSSLSAILSTSAPYRLIAARILPPEAVAVYGFASGIAEMISRYTPTRLMQIAIRTVLVARHSERGDRADLIAKLGLNFRLNTLMLSLAVAFTLACGQPVLDWLTGGKYGQAAWLLAALLGILMLDVLRAQLEFLAEVCERNQWILVGNLAVILALVAAYPLTLHLGHAGLALAGAIGGFCALLVILTGLRPEGAPGVIIWRRVVPILALPGLGWAVSLIPLPDSMSAWLAGALTILACLVVLLLWPPLSPAERKMIFNRLLKSPSSQTSC